MIPLFKTLFLLLLLVIANSGFAKDRPSKIKEFENRLDIIEALYGDLIFEKFGAPLKINKMWNVRQVFFQADVDEAGEPNIYLGGGALILPKYTPDVFTLIVCHEIGHLIGGAPYKTEHHYSSSVEGQADFFAASCTSKVFENKRIIKTKPQSITDRETDEFCSHRDIKIGTNDSCMRIIHVLSNLFSDNLKKSGDLNSILNMEFPKIEHTLNQRPSTVCQIYTFLAALSGLERPSCWYKKEVRIFGNTPMREFPTLDSDAQKVWNFWDQRLSLPSGLTPPEIYFYSFQRHIQTNEFTQWQSHWLLGNTDIWSDWADLKNKNGQSMEITREWIVKNVSSIFPFPKTFLAFHYDRTNRIQMNPERTMLSTYQNDPYGIKRDFLGAGYYSMGHEMLHYALQEKVSIPTKLHHCLFVTPHPETGRMLIDDMAQFLVDEKLSATSMIKMGPSSETKMDPCKRMNSDEISLIQKTLKSL